MLKPGIFITLSLLLSACSFGPAPAPRLTPSPASIPTLALLPPMPTAPLFQPAPMPTQIIPTLTIPPTTIPSPIPTLTALPSTGGSPSFAHPVLIVLAQNLPGPDDLALAPDGSIFISDIQDGTVKRMVINRSLQLVLSGLSEPEGMAFLPDGSLVIAEQGKDRLLRYDLTTKSLSLFYQLNNQTGQMGVDGIILDDHDPGHESLIVPDSANGALLRLSLDGKQAATITANLKRPTGAWVEPDGSILVTDENAGSLLRVRPGGNIELLGNYSVPDDVIEDAAGNIFVVSIGDDSVHVIPAGTRQVHILSSDFSSPQGLIFDQKGNLIVTDPGNLRVVMLMIRK